MEPPGLFVHVGSFDDGEHFDDAQALADALGRPVHEPAWPAAAGPRLYVLDRADSFYRPTDRYDILAEMPDGESPLHVTGYPGPSCWRDGEQGWWAVPELVHVDGLEQTEGDSPHVVVEISGMAVHLSFRSNHESVAAALTLREYRPQSRG